jgi:ribose transport system permease protein
MTMSVRSTSLEPGPDDYRGAGLRLLLHKIARTIPVFGLVYLTALLIAVFSLALPDTFPTYLNFKLIANGKAVLAILALAVTIPMAVGKIDVSIGYAVGLYHILVLVLQINYGLPWPVACVAVLVLATVIGLLNGLLVELAQVDAFVATLGSGTLLYAAALFVSEGKQIVDRNGVISDAFFGLSRWELLAIPGPFVLVLVLAFAMWLVFEHTPIGRYLYASGANPRAAELNGIPRRRYVYGSFMTSGFLAGVAAILLAARLGVGQSNIGLDFLLPALVAAFLGSTTIKPGRVNPWGTFVGIVILAVGISGIQQFGTPFFVDPLFNGLTLIVAISIASYAGRRRVNAVERHALKRTGPPADPPAAPAEEATG